MADVVACVNALASVPDPSGIPALIAWARRIQEKQRAECTCDGDYRECDFVALDAALRACGIEGGETSGAVTVTAHAAGRLAERRKRKADRKGKD